MTEIPINLMYTDNEHLIPARLFSASDEMLAAYSSIDLPEGTLVTLVLIKFRFKLQVVSTQKVGNEYLIEIRCQDATSKFSQHFSNFLPKSQAS